jgi:polyhydroxyalkanoate synthase
MPTQLATQLMQIWSGRSDLAPDPKDRRFQDPAWASNPFYKAWLQSYLAWGTWLDTTVGALNLERHTNARTTFLLGQIRDALAPTNFFWGNPAAVRRAFETGGASTLRGAANWLEDVAHHGGMPTQVDRRPFKVGENMAATPGAVVYRTDMFELLQYTPQTEQVYARPLLVVPPQVNRYYAVDLAPGRSLLEHLVRGGIQLFTIVWRNPGPEQRDWGFEAYARAILEATDVVRDITGSPDVNASGACAGGMTLTLLLGHLAARGDRRINAASLLVTMLDTSVESQLSLLADETTLELAGLASEQAGILTGEQLSQVFSFLRPNDLVWNYWTNNYLLGEDPPAFDVLAWNSDATNLTARLHRDLMDLVKSNALTRKNALHFLDTPIDLSKVTCDMFVVAAQNDHIVPWQGCYAATHLLRGKTHFVLSASGHIQSIVSPPGNAKARFLTNPRTPRDAHAWLAGATEQRGSWWDSYTTWLAERGGEQRPAPRELGTQTYPVLAAAPGTYVFE